MTDIVTSSSSDYRAVYLSATDAAATTDDDVVSTL